MTLPGPAPDCRRGRNVRQGADHPGLRTLLSSGSGGVFPTASGLGHPTVVSAYVATTNWRPDAHEPRAPRLAGEKKKRERPVAAPSAGIPPDSQPSQANCLTISRTRGADQVSATNRDHHGRDVAARISEFVDVRTPWHRALWQASSVLTLEELCEYGELVETKAVQAQQLIDAAASASSILAKDPGLGDESLCRTVLALLTTPRDMEAEAERDELARLAERANVGYLERWASVLVLPEGERPRPERVARHLTAHLLDQGVSYQAILKVCTAAIESDAMTSASLCAELSALLVEPRKWRVIVPLEALPSGLTARTPMESRLVTLLPNRAQLESAHSWTWPADYQAGLTVAVKARDPWAAVEQAKELLARVQARLSVSLGAGALPELLDVAVEGYERPFRVSDDRRKVVVPSLVRSGKILRIAGYAEADALDDSLELLASLGGGTTGAALTNGWAALEGLLVKAGEKGQTAAERSADIVTMAWPRAEMTWLANAPFVEESTPKDLWSDLRRTGPGSIDKKVATLEAALTRRSPPAYDRPRDVAALHRLENLVASPSDALDQVRQAALVAFRRLYVQRNLVMHAGSFRSVARGTTLRTAPPLAAATLDRIVHAAEYGTTPVMLAARARIELRLINDGSRGRPLYQLLD